MKNSNSASQKGAFKRGKSKPPKSPEWFLSQGCKQVPPEACKNILRWGHPDGYFLKVNGQKAVDDLSESHKRHCNNHPAPNLANGWISCHVAMALAFYGERDVFVDEKTGKSYFGECHHLNANLEDYRPANLLCWLSRPEHRIADKRQRALRTVVPDGNLYLFSYERLRELQDPRTMSDQAFESELEAIRKKGYHIVEPLHESPLLLDLKSHE